MTKGTGGQAFPKYWYSNYEGEPTIEHEGMTLRDYFAGQAISGLLVRLPNIQDESNISIGSYAIADALLAERSKHNANT